MEELKTIWVRRRLVTASSIEDKYEVTVLDEIGMVYMENFTRKFSEPEAAIDYATLLAHWFERIPAA